MMGSSIDELIRHHPVLKSVVFDALNCTLQKVEQMGYAFIPPSDIRPWYLLTAVSPPESDIQDVAMKDVEGSSNDDSTKSSGEDVNNLDDPSSKLHDNTIVSFIDVLSRVRYDIYYQTKKYLYLFHSSWKGCSSILHTAKISLAVNMGWIACRHCLVFHVFHMTSQLQSVSILSSKYTEQ